MIAIQFLVEWALRSSILVLNGALLLWMLRVKDSAVFQQFGPEYCAGR
jgi:hypothetical protein